MTCVGCQERREAIRKMAEKVGTIVFGGRRRIIASFSDRNGAEGGEAGLDQSAAKTNRTDAGAAAVGNDGAAAAVAAAAGNGGGG